MLRTGMSPVRWWETASTVLCSLMRRSRTERLDEVAKSSAAPLRALASPGSLMRLLTNPLFSSRLAGAERGDPLFAVRYRHYLRRGMSLALRMKCAAAHFECEATRYDPAYYKAVYGPAGMELWSCELPERRYAIVLRDSGGSRHEGALSVALVCGTKSLHVTSYSWLTARLAHRDARGPACMYLARNQSMRADTIAMQHFRSDFPQQSPAYLCMAAAAGIAQANGLGHVLAVHHESQVSFEEHLSSGFRSSYSEFWQTFGGELRSADEWHIPIPVALTPVELVAQKHRARARARRKFWFEICEGAETAIRPHVAPAVARPLPRSSEAPGPAPTGSGLLSWPALLAWLAAALALAWSLQD